MVFLGTLLVADFLAQQFLDTAGSERVNKKLTQRFLGCLARVAAERRRTERFPEKL